MSNKQEKRLSTKQKILRGTTIFIAITTVVTMFAGIIANTL